MSDKKHDFINIFMVNFFTFSVYRVQTVKRALSPSPPKLRDGVIPNHKQLLTKVTQIDKLFIIRR